MHTFSTVLPKQMHTNLSNCSFQRRTINMTFDTYWKIGEIPRNLKKKQQ